MPRPTLVTGAAGFAGSHLIDLLAPTGVARSPGTAGAAFRRSICLPPRGKASMCWIIEAVRAALARLRPAAVYHFAGAAHVGRSWDRVESTFAVNVRATAHLIDGLRAIGGDARVLIPSSAMIYAASNDPIPEDHPAVPASPYGLSKLAQELVGRLRTRADRMSSSGARFNHFGPRQDPEFAASGFARPVAEIEAGRQPAEIAVGNLDARARSLTDVRDSRARLSAHPRARHAGSSPQHCTRDARSSSAICSKCSWRGRACRSRSRSIPPA